MERFVRGDVVILPFPFSDLTGAKRRPALVLADLGGDDAILCQITSRAGFDKYAVEICINDFLFGSLPLNSYARPNKLFTADKSLIISTAGRLNHRKIEEVIKFVINIFS